MGHLMPLMNQFLSQFAHTLTRPTQWRFWIASRHRLHQSFQILAEMLVLAHGFLAPASSAANTSLALWGLLCLFLELFDALTNSLAGESSRATNQRDPSPSNRHGL